VEKSRMIKLKYVDHAISGEEMRALHNAMVDVINAMSERLEIVESTLPGGRDARQTHVVDYRQAKPL